MEYQCNDHGHRELIPAVYDISADERRAKAFDVTLQVPNDVRWVVCGEQGGNEPDGECRPAQRQSAVKREQTAQPTASVRSVRRRIYRHGAGVLASSAQRCWRELPAVGADAGDHRVAQMTPSCARRGDGERLCQR